MEKQQVKDNSFRNIIIFSVGFMLLMAAWLTIAAIVQMMLYSVHVDDPTFTGDGFLSMTLINGVFSLSNFFTPLVVSLVGVRTTLVLGSSTYAIFIASFFRPNAWLMYLTSSLLGFAAANVWVANGMYFTRCSTKETIGRNMGIYWVIMCLGQLLGSTFVFWKFQGMSHIDSNTRFIVVFVLTCISIMATATFMFLGPPGAKKSDAEAGTKTVEKSEKPASNIRKVLLEPFTLLSDKHMLLLIPPALYNGLEIAFYMGIFPTAIGFTERFGEDARKLVGVAGILTGVGTVTAGVLFGIFGDIVVKSKRNRIIMIACISHCICVVLLWLNLADKSTSHPTNDVSWMNPPSVTIIMICAFLLGIGDGCVSPQMGAAIGVIWPDNPSAALAIYRFFQAAFCSIGFFISTVTGLHNQLLIFLTTALVGTVTFCINEHLIEKKDKGLVKPVMHISVLKTQLSVTNDFEKK